MNVKAIKGYGYQMDTINETHDPLDGKIILNHYGEPLYHLNNQTIEVNLVKLTQQQKDFGGHGFDWVYFIN